MARIRSKNRGGAHGKPKSFESGDKPTASYAETAARLGLNEGTLKSLAHRLRQRFGKLVRQEIAHTASSPAEIEDEIRYLIAVVSGE